MIAIKIERIIFAKDRLRLIVIVDERFSRNTYPELISIVRREYPHLSSHSCVNGKGPLFSDVMDDTSIPHLLEHMIIDEQVKASEDPQQGKPFVGATEWSDEAHGKAEIELSYDDDLIALRCVKNALASLNRFMHSATMN